jgi:Ca2+-binding EF-hand superfamily protein
MFKMMDIDNSGSISYDKLKASLHKLGSQMDESEVQILMDATDADGNGMLDYREFVAASLHMQSIDNDDYLRKAFLFFDKDGSEIEEFREALADDFGPNDIDGQVGTKPMYGMVPLERRVPSAIVNKSIWGDTIRPKRQRDVMILQRLSFLVQQPKQISHVSIMKTIL